MANADTDNVFSREDFVKYVVKLREDLACDPSNWVNCDLGDFLEAIASWVEDMDGYYRYRSLPVPENIDWNFFAGVLTAAKFYE